MLMLVLVLVLVLVLMLVLVVAAAVDSTVTADDHHPSATRAYSAHKHYANEAHINKGKPCHLKKRINPP